MKRIPASAATRERLQQLFDGQSEVEDVKGALVREALRLIVEEGLEGEACDALGRGYYETDAASALRAGRGAWPRPRPIWSIT